MPRSDSVHFASLRGEKVTLPAIEDGCSLFPDAVAPISAFNGPNQSDWPDAVTLLRRLYASMSIFRWYHRIGHSDINGMFPPNNLAVLKGTAFFLGSRGRPAYNGHSPAGREGAGTKNDTMSLRCIDSGQVCADSNPCKVTTPKAEFVGPSEPDTGALG